VIVDTRTLPDGQLIEADLCIIGAGPAGISIAREFSTHSLRVCVLESGGLELDDATQALCEGENVGHEYFPLDASRLRYFGGASNHWGGMCGMLSPIDFEERPWVQHSGWPFPLGQLLPFYARAQLVCELGAFDYDPAYWEDTIGAPRLPLGASVLPTIVIQYSPPTRFGERYREELQSAQNISVYLNTNVLEIDTNEQASHVTALSLATVDGKRRQARAKAYILAAGGIENPRLLLLSSAVQRSGLGNDHDLVGRFFMEHPYCDCGLLIPSDPYLDLRLYDAALRRRPGVRANASLALSDQVQREKRWPNACCGVRVEYAVSEGEQSLLVLLGRRKVGAAPEDLSDHVANIMRDFGAVSTAVYRRALGLTKPVERAVVGVCWEQIPNPASRVQLGSTRDRFDQRQVQLNWVVPETDKQLVRQIAELFAAEVGKSGLGRVQVWPDDDRWFARLEGAHHHMGTTRIHVDPKRGVVNPDCRVHGIDNLFVAGSSVFPTTGYINPTLTIVALSLRLADHLKDIVV
jgi:choline dehydrogenase-like flavoprotein